MALGRNGGGLSPTAVPGQVTSVQYGPPFSSDAEGDGPGPSPSIAKPKARRVPRDVKATICPKCGGPARWACTETGRWGLQRQCDAVFCRVCGSNGVCVCAMDSYPNAHSSPAGRCGTEFPGALTSVNLGPEFPSDVAGDGPGRDTHGPTPLLLTPSSRSAPAFSWACPPRRLWPLWMRFLLTVLVRRAWRR